MFFFVIIFIMGGIGALSFSPYNFWPAAIVSLYSLQLLTIDCKIKKSAILGFVWGIGFFGTGTNWLFFSISKFTEISFLINILIILIFICYLSIYPSIYLIILNLLWPKINIYRLVFASPAIWHITEFLRGKLFTGFPWLQFGYSQIDGPLKGLAPIAGVETITFYIITIVGLLVYSYLKRNLFYLKLVFLILIIFYPLNYIHWYKPISKLRTRISMVQGNISPILKWDDEHLSSAINTYMSLSKRLLIKKTIFIWPECAIADLEKNQQIFLHKLDNILKLSKSNLITGIIDSDTDEKNVSKNYNSIIVLGDNKYPYLYNNLNRYRKFHLVPFGEFIPSNSFLKFIFNFLNFSMSSLSSGSYIQPSLHVNNYNLTSIICYELIFGEQIRSNLKSKTNFLLAISNNSWFGKTIGPWQHFQMARMRSLELGRPLLHCTNNGITAIVNANGDIESILPQFIKGVLSKDVIPTNGNTPYFKLGFWPIWILSLINILISFLKPNFNYYKYNFLFKFKKY